MASSKRAAAGCGTIRKKIVQHGCKEYVYRDARYSNGFDPGTGKQIQKSISGNALSLLWNCVDLTESTITVDKQLRLIRSSRGQYQMDPTKNSKSRTLALAPTVTATLKRVHLRRRYQNRPGKFRSFHRRFYPGCIQPCHPENEEGKRCPDGSIYPSCQCLRETIREAQDLVF